MNASEMLDKVDHTQLKPTATWQDIAQLCEEAVQYATASACIPPAFVARAHAAYPALNLCTVIGFPLGYAATAVKVCEAKQALADGANEVDVVVNLGDVKDGAFERITAEIAALKAAAGTHILKVIVETCYLTQAEKIALCGCVTKGGADFIKTSTGFGTAGAQLEDIALFRSHIGPGVQIKASGGIRTREQIEQFLQAGCARIGCSAAVKALAGDIK